MKKVLISASTNPAKSQEELLKYVKAIEKDIDFIHCDVMDGKFVEVKCFSVEEIKAINDISTVRLDTHLMIEKPQKHIEKYAKAGSNIITIHFEAFKNIKALKKCLKKIKKLNCLCGVSINPDTEVKNIESILNIVDLVLVMSVVPGKSGQTFIKESLIKIKTLSQLRFKYNYKYLIEVDGGINNENCEIIVNNGADILVSGNYLYKSKDYLKTINILKGLNI